MQVVGDPHIVEHAPGLEQADVLEGARDAQSRDLQGLQVPAIAREADVPAVGDTRR
jgi:hypothetical protein